MRIVLFTIAAICSAALVDITNLPLRERPDEMHKPLKRVKVEETRANRIPVELNQIQLAMNRRHLGEAVNVLYTSFAKTLPGWSVLARRFPMLALFKTSEELANLLSPLSSNTRLCNVIVDTMSRAIAGQFKDWDLLDERDPFKRHPQLLHLLTIMQTFVLSELFNKVGKYTLEWIGNESEEKLAYMKQRIGQIRTITGRSAITWISSVESANQFLADAITLFESAYFDLIPKFLAMDYPNPFCMGCV